MNYKLIPPFYRSSNWVKKSISLQYITKHSCPQGSIFMIQLLRVLTDPKTEASSETSLFSPIVKDADPPVERRKLYEVLDPVFSGELVSSIVKFESESSITIFPCLTFLSNCRSSSTASQVTIPS